MQPAPIHPTAEIHPTAIVHPSAVLGPQVSVGPYCLIGENVEVGAQTRLDAHVVLEGPLRMGMGNRVHSFAVLGGAPQDKSYSGEVTTLHVGDGNIIREYVTMSRGTVRGRAETRVGHRGLFMAHSHVAHDCWVGDHAILSNGVALAGHVTIEDGAILGGMVGVHQFVRIGRLAMVAAGAMVAQDVPPFCLVQGDRARLRGLNRVGLKRAGMDATTLRQLHRAYSLLFRSGLGRQEALEQVRRELASFLELEQLLAFFADSRRGICRASGRLESSADDG